MPKPRPVSGPGPTPPPLWASRITELRYCLPSEMQDHPLQHKIHGAFQREVMLGLLGDVGIADALRAYVSPTTGEFITLDGHLRRSLGETPWPTLVLDVDDDEAAHILLFGDEVAHLAEKDVQALARLSASVSTESEAVTQLLHGLLQTHQAGPLTPGELSGGLAGDLPDADQDEAPDFSGDGALLQRLDVTLADPRHVVVSGEVYRLMDRHILICAEVISEWALWVGYLTSPDMLCCPYPGPFVVLGERATRQPLLLIQPVPYIAGHILDRVADVYGEGAIVVLKEMPA